MPGGTESEQLLTSESQRSKVVNDDLWPLRLWRQQLFRLCYTRQKPQRKLNRTSLTKMFCLRSQSMLPNTFAKQICRSNAAKCQSIYKVYKLVVHAVMHRKKQWIICTMTVGRKNLLICSVHVSQKCRPLVFLMVSLSLTLASVWSKSLSGSSHTDSCSWASLKTCRKYDWYLVFLCVLSRWDVMVSHFNTASLGSQVAVGGRLWWTNKYTFSVSNFKLARRIVWQ